jgi:hypothetical protein
MENPDEKEKEKTEKGPKLTRGERIAKRIDQVNMSLYVATFGLRMRFLFFVLCSRSNYIDWLKRRKATPS